jgi:hypothetical protein
MFSYRILTAFNLLLFGRLGASDFIVYFRHCFAWMADDELGGHGSLGNL